VPHSDDISPPPKASYVIVYDDSGHFTVLPLLTMTGLESKANEAGTKPKQARRPPVWSPCGVFFLA
jgi:hypothetical protein